MIIPVILSGGSGTRLWPLSRKLFPKQYINLLKSNSLFQDTIVRLPDDVESPIIICNEEHRFIVAEQLRELKLNHNGIILEPIGKNTAPAIAIAAMNTYSESNDPTLVILSTDHQIGNIEKLGKAIKLASKIASQDKIVALGVKPNKPLTGYGYIEVENSSKNDYFKIISFKEKPNLSDAKVFIKSDCYYWNSGIFVFKASTYLKELKKFEPEIYKACKNSLEKSNKDLDFIRVDMVEFNKCPDKSIDYAVMEKTAHGIVVPYDGKWSDLGSWDSLWYSQSKDSNNNVIKGDITTNEVKNSYIHSSDRLVSVNDLSNVIIIDTKDALLVSSKKKSQNIKNIVQKLKKENRKEADYHSKVYRPWGYYDSLDFGTNFQVKRILVNPGAKLSLQKHLKRAEHWVVVRGVACITCRDRIFRLKANESTYIPKGEVHRLENKEKTPLEIIEIQTGNYLGEDDIIRLEDDYSRHL